MVDVLELNEVRIRSRWCVRPIIQRHANLDGRLLCLQIWIERNEQSRKTHEHARDGEPAGTVCNLEKLM